MAFADAPIEDGIYYITCSKEDGYLGLGAYHNADPYIYYVTDGQEKTTDAYWEIISTPKGYTFRNADSGELLVFTLDRVDQFYKYMTLANEPLGDDSEYWNIISGSDGAYSIQSAIATEYYWNLRAGSYMMGTYKGSSGNSPNERYVFYKTEDVPGPQPDERHEFVDLELPSGTLWATCNVGAKSPEEYGDYFAWGETHKKDKYVDGNYEFFDNGQVTKYNATDGMTELLAVDDASTVAFGAEWKTPSKEQWDELLNASNTTIEWTEMNGVNGKKITSIRNGNSVFLPAAGVYTSLLSETGQEGTYWSRSLNAEQDWEACYLSFDHTSFIGTYYVYRNYGMTIRPVHNAETISPTDQYTVFTFPNALHVYLSDGRIEAYPLKYVTDYTENEGLLTIETNIGQTFTYDLSEVDSVKGQKPEFPTFDTFKFSKKNNDQVFGTVTGEMEGDTVFVSIAAIGKRLTPSFTFADETTEVYVNNKLQAETGDRLRFDKDIYYVVSPKGCRMLLPGEDNKFFMRPYGRVVRVHVDWLTDRAEVPTIYINTADGQPITSKDYFKDATITIDGHGIFPSMEETAMQIKGRGNSSWGWPKKPYRLKFAEKVKPLGMTKGKSWVLLSNYQSGSLMSNAIGMKAANLMKASAANHIVPVDLYLNGEYRGSYNFTEKVGFANNSVDLPDETTAAMLELDSYFDEPEGQKFRSSPYGLPINIKEPDFSEGTTSLTLETIQTSFNSFLAALYRGKDISRYVDIEQLARFMMVNELTLNYEFYHPKSTFCYRENFLEDTCKYVFGPVWDLDWCFGYEKNRNYFIREAESNYWKDMPSSMNAITFIQDLRFKYEPLDSVYRALWEEFMQNDLQELLEYAQDYYDFAKNSFSANTGKWGDNTNYAQQAQTAANWLNVRSQKIYDDIVAGVRPDISEPAEPIEFANNKLYTITCKRGDLILSYDYKGLEAGQSAWWTVFDYEKQFAIINIEGNNYLYNPYLKKYLRTGTAQNGEWVEALGSPIYFDTTKPNGEYLYMMSTLTEKGNIQWFNNNGSTIVINNYNTPDEGDRWKITEVGEFDPTSAILLAQADMYAVTNRYIWNGEVIGSETRKMPKGAEPPAPSERWDNAFVRLIEPDNLPYQIDGDTNIDYEVEWYGPFDFTTSTEDAHWYTMTIRSDYMVGKSSSEPYIPEFVQDFDDTTLLNFLWAFGGNPYNVILYNGTTMFAETLTLVGNNAVMRQGTYEWELLPFSDGFILRVPGSEYICLNQIGGEGGPLQSWNDGRSLTDNGSTFRVTPAPDPDGISLVEALTGAENAVYDLSGRQIANDKWQNGKLPKGIYIVNGKKVLIR